MTDRTINYGNPRYLRKLVRRMEIDKFYDDLYNYWKNPPKPGEPIRSLVEMYGSVPVMVDDNIDFMEGITNE